MFTIMDFIRDYAFELERLMRRNGYNKHALAKEIGVQPTVLTRHIRGEVLPDMVTLVNLSFALNCDIEDIVMTEDEIDEF